MPEFQEVLAIAGDGGIIALLYVVWRFDRRIYRLEVGLHAATRKLHDHIIREESKLDMILGHQNLERREMPREIPE